MKIQRSRPAVLAGRAKLPFPASPKLRVAQLSPGPKFESVEPFVPKRWLEMEAYRPRVLVGEVADFERLHGELQLGMLDLACVDRALIVLTRYRAQPISDTMRVTLWQAFGVPIFELYLGPDNGLLAAECGAHEGWHLEPGIESWQHNGELILDSPGNYGLRTGLAGNVKDEPCPCGRATPRLVDMEALHRLSHPLKLAASA